MDNEEEDSRVTDQLLLQAEKFKARVEAPKGYGNNHSYSSSGSFNNMIMPYNYDKLRSKFVSLEGLGPIDNEILFLRNFDQDDEFFHITSQIEPAVKTKIERGEFIDLERLLPKDRVTNRGDDLNRQLYQLITQGTNTFLDTPVPKSGKINNIRKWDQAFRVYAAIYTYANPNRASEIWQYVYVIHTAAASNSWDNVYYYDINFRELMASKPWHSWGKTYTQGWNMAFNNNNSNNYYNANSTAINTQGGHSSNASLNQKSWKDDCCWRYNKNRCKKSGTECNYDHRCTFCAGWNHSFFNCKKRLGKQKRTFQNGNNNKTATSSPKKEKN